MRDRLGRYEILEHLAQGGMGELYVGRGDGDDFDVVLKCVQARSEDDPRHSRTRMFLDEARVTTLIRHENVIRVHEVNYEEGIYYLVMEKLEGWDLAEVGDRLHKNGGQLPVPVVTHLVAKACLGLHAAHECTTERGEPLHLVHRDVSPGNLFITRAGALKVLDFGIAKTSIQVAKTRVGFVKGKFSYMSPEQARGQELDRRSDLFSVGIVLHELLACRRLFTRDTPHDTMTAILHDVLVPPARPDGSVGGELMAVTMRALSRDRDLRFATAAEMAEALVAAVPEAERVDPAEIAGYLTELFADDRGPKASVPSSAPRSLRQWAETITARLQQAITDDEAPEATETVVPRPPDSPIVSGETVADLAPSFEADANVPPRIDAVVDSPEPERAPGPAPLDGADTSVAGGDTTDQELNPRPALERLSTLGSVTVRDLRSHWRRWPAAAIAAGLAAATVIAWAAWPGAEPVPEPVVAPPVEQPVSPPPEERPTVPRKAPRPAKAKNVPRPAKSPPTVRPKSKSKRVARATGRLTLDSKPWANVFIQGKMLGPTPLVEHPLPAGKVAVRLVNPQLGIEKTVALDIPANDLLRATIVLDQ